MATIPSASFSEYSKNSTFNIVKKDFNLYSCIQIYRNKCWHHNITTEYNEMHWVLNNHLNFSGTLGPPTNLSSSSEPKDTSDSDRVGQFKVKLGNNYMTLLNEHDQQV